jgi:lysozyme family protein
MSNFEICLKYVLEAEGHLSDDKDDTGGITKYGISYQTYKNKYPSATREDIKNLSLEEASRFYDCEFWQACNCDEMRLPIALLVFDTAVNCSPTMAKKFLQRALNVKDDGILGPQTYKALKSSSDEKIIPLFTARRNKYYSDICTPLLDDTESRKQIKLLRRRKYLDGWLNRAAKMEYIATNLGK